MATKQRIIVALKPDTHIPDLIKQGRSIGQALTGNASFQRRSSHFLVEFDPPLRDDLDAPSRAEEGEPQMDWEVLPKWMGQPVEQGLRR